MWMARFTYTAEKAGGEVYNGTAEAKDRFELYDIVRREGGRVVSVEEESKFSFASITAYMNAHFTTIPEYEKVLFARNLGAMISAGLSLARALAVIERQTKNPRLKSVVAELAGAVRRGETLHSALAQFPHVFTKLFVAMVRAGEEGGELSQSLGIVGDQMERMYNLKKKIRGALIYPAIIVTAIIAIGAFMMVNVVPTLAQTFQELDAELPASTQAIISLSNFLVSYTVLALSAVVLLFGGIYTALQTQYGRRARDFIFIHIPLISPIVKEVNAARTSRTLASLLASGVDVLTALEIVGDVVQNGFFRDVIQEAKDNVGKGEPLSSAFVRSEKLYPPFVGEMMSVGEETGALTEMMKRIAIFYEDEVDRKTKDMSTIIEPFLMLAIGGAVGFFAVAMISPIYQLSENI